MINNLINWFNGKKTTIAAILMALSMFITEVLIGIWGMEVDWFPMLVKTLNWVGMILGGTGLIHKAIKTNP